MSPHFFERHRPVRPVSLGSGANGAGKTTLMKTIVGQEIILDEPANDLDLPTLRELEAALLEFPGVVICVMHDRFFLDRIATHILAFEGDEEGLGAGVAMAGRGDSSGRVLFHPGNDEIWREDHSALREKAGLPPIESVGAHRKFSGS